MPTPDLKYAKGHFRHLALNRREAFIWYWARHSQTDENFKKYREAEPLVNNERTLDHVTLHELLANRLETIGVARRGLRGHAPQIFKTHSQFVLQEAVPQTSLIRLKSNIWATTKFFDPPNFWAGCATAQAGSSIPPTKIVRSGVVFVTRCIMSRGLWKRWQWIFRKTDFVTRQGYFSFAIHPTRRPYLPNVKGHRTSARSPLRSLCVRSEPWRFPAKPSWKVKALTQGAWSPRDLTTKGPYRTRQGRMQPLRLEGRRFQ